MHILLSAALSATYLVGALALPGESAALSDALASDDECRALDGSVCAVNELQVIKKKSEGSQALHAEELLAMAANATHRANHSGGPTVRYEQTCYGFTGGTCTVTSCDADRGAKCKSGLCVCDGGCSGPDGVCHSSSYKKVAGSFRLQNMKWPKYYLYVQRVSAFDQMKVTNAYSWLNAGADKFDLYQLPGALDGKPKFFLASAHWRDIVATIRATAGTTLGLWGLYAAKLEARVKPYNPENIALSVCSWASKGHPDAIMVGSAGYLGNPIWAYIKHGSWLVYGYSFGGISDVGDGGRWIPDPPLPKGLLPEC
mmetsp:Transcript_86379/g.239537  ORF Transcript_86379/g.239537 Transcript_86379/m.239537 type:complete len:313 (+) Transcript_86379:75-1013(+)|eukprot:CAMPEP_0179086254 /NCGR_PEP_ID=MMETSP0796-20121207/39114_1 /TAXON_ID=73915 /ORGANISM="Pyrodinium bahamense, Strain pbaha01" /LENGTH=312 /DNA_ID=CAMNT_0020783717 /DNA_START=66 /DNA_END=1004 /DNA_ORIENTATION=-